MIKVKRPTISALIKCQNEETFLKECINSIKPFVNEIVLINNNSTDGSVKIANSLGVKVVNFEGFPGGNISLADYYNWCTAQTSGDYVIKWDADIVAFEFYNEATKHLNWNIEAVFYPLFDMYGDHKHTRKNITCGPEPYVFRRDIQHYNNHDGIERLPFWGERPAKVIRIDKSLGLHMNIKSSIRYALREIMKEYRKINSKMSLEDWANQYYDLNKEAEKIDLNILKDVVPYNGTYPKILNDYISNPKWLIEQGKRITVV
jgi:glycosyltransferase involved in cell wall biosynthesis